jgi:alpha-tubulin suppressor-like RCC1 family protein
LSAGTHHTCAITSAGAGYCWGKNDQGALGDGTTEARVEPTPLAGDLVFRSISAGTHFGCGIAGEGKAHCWGHNGFGQLGEGSAGMRSSPVVAAPGLTLAYVVAGSYHACGVTPAGEAHCWGRDLKTPFTATSRSDGAVPVGGAVRFVVR